MAYFNVGLFSIFLASSKPLIIPKVLNPKILPAVAVAAIWFEKAPPKVIEDVKTKKTIFNQRKSEINKALLNL